MSQPIKPVLPVDGLNCGRCCTKIENLSVARGGRIIIHDINLHIHCGELTAIIGPNGAGKSTLLKAVIGEVPFKGNIRFLSAKGKRSGKPLVGYVPQRWDFDPGMPVSVNDLFLTRHKSRPVWLFPARKKRDEIIRSLSIVHAEHLIDRKMGQLSGGEIQRVLLALAMDPVPDLLLLDEPVSGVDYQGRKVFYQVVSELRKNYDLSIILVSHDLELMRLYADRMALLDRTILCTGAPEQVLNNERVLSAFDRIKDDQGPNGLLVMNAQGGNAF